MAKYQPHNLGEQAEHLAQQVLRSQGLRLVEKNFRCKLGEIDLIFIDEDCLVFTEVRARTSNNVMDQFDSIDEFKQRKIIRTAELFMLKNPQFDNYLCRFDAIAVNFSEPKPSIRWIKDAFTCD